MRIVKAGNHAAPMEIDHPRRGAGEAKDLSRCPNLKDAIAIDGDGFGLWLGGILGPDMTMHQDQAGKALSVRGGRGGNNNARQRKRYRCMQAPLSAVSQSLSTRKGHFGECRWP